MAIDDIISDDGDDDSDEETDDDGNDDEPEFLNYWNNPPLPSQQSNNEKIKFIQAYILIL